MLITEELLNRLTEEAKANPRLRQSFDLRNSARDNSQRMLNALEPGTVLSIHRHRSTSEVTSVVRGAVRQNIYDDRGALIETFDVYAHKGIAFYVTPAGAWHNTECLETGTIIFEAKDGAYAPLSQDDVMTI